MFIIIIIIIIDMMYLWQVFQQCSLLVDDALGTSLGYIEAAPRSPRAWPRKVYLFAVRNL